LRHNGLAFCWKAHIHKDTLFFLTRRSTFNNKKISHSMCERTHFFEIKNSYKTKNKKKISTTLCTKILFLNIYITFFPFVWYYTKTKKMLDGLNLGNFFWNCLFYTSFLITSKISMPWKDKNSPTNNINTFSQLCNLFLDCQWKMYKNE